MPDELEPIIGFVLEVQYCPVHRRRMVKQTNAGAIVYLRCPDKTCGFRSKGPSVPKLLPVELPISGKDMTEIFTSKG